MGVLGGEDGRCVEKDYDDDYIVACSAVDGDWEEDYVGRGGSEGWRVGRCD